MPGNNRCVDCDAPYPQWATVSYGTFMCLECSGRHRGLGVHISFVRSVTMDSWTDKQIRMMQLGGNEQFKEAFASAGVPTTLSIQQKYNTPQAEAYRQRLSALADNKPAQQLPRWDPSCLQSSATTSTSSFASRGDSKGVEALKGESEEDYVARQHRLREEARARMQAKFGSSGMQGIGSSGESGAPSNNGGISDLSSAFGFLSTTVSSTVASAANIVKDQNLGNKVSSGWSYVQSTIADPNLTSTVKSGASTGWSALSSGASAMWKTAQSVVETAVQPPPNDGGHFPRTNPSLSSSGKYSGMGGGASDSGTAASARDHDNDSWLDAQLGQGSTQSASKASSFNGMSVMSNGPSRGSSHASSFSASSSSALLQSQSKAATAPVAASNVDAPPPTPVPTPAPAPIAAPKPKKKDVDFFGEYGF